LELAGTVIPISSILARQLAEYPADRRDIVLGVRPEDVLLGRDAGQQSVPGEVFVVEDLGNERLVTLDLGDQFVVARVAADYPAEMGQQLSFGFLPERAHLFDPESQRRLE